MANVAPPTLRLRNGVEIDDPLTTALEFIAQDSSYTKYDLAPVAQDNLLTVEDIRTANWMIARMSKRVIGGIYARAERINAALALIPQPATLGGAEHEVPWSGLDALMRAIHGAPEVGLARATKVLHKKRPALLPILDSVVAGYLRGVDGLRKRGDFAEDAVELIRSYKRELDANLVPLRALQAELRPRGIDLTELRLLDLFLWGYSGTYTPLYLRDGVAATAAPKTATARARPAPAISTDGYAIELFRDDDEGYLAWLRDHPQGFVLNAARAPRADYLILHRAGCRTISGVPTRGGPWTGPYIKVCSAAARARVISKRPPDSLARSAECPAPVRLLRSTHWAWSRASTTQSWSNPGGVAFRTRRADVGRAEGVAIDQPDGRDVFRLRGLRVFAVDRGNHPQGSTLWRSPNNTGQCARGRSRPSERSGIDLQYLPFASRKLIRCAECATQLARRSRRWAIYRPATNGLRRGFRLG